MTKRLPLLLLSLSAGLPVSLLSQTGHLTVTVKSPAGSPVVGANVIIAARPTYDQMAPGQVRQVLYHSSAKTTTAGTATFQSVPVSAYAVCAYPASSTLVDTCSWSERAPAIFVGANEAASLSVGLRSGALLTVIVNDSGQLLQTAATASRQFRIGVGVRKGPWHPMAITTSGAFSRQYSLLIPADTDLKLLVGSFGYMVADQAGKPLKSNDPSAFVPVRIPSASGSRTIQLTLVGVI